MNKRTLFYLSEKQKTSAKGREEENEDRKNEGGKDVFSLDVLYFLDTTNA